MPTGKLLSSNNSCTLRIALSLEKMLNAVLIDTSMLFSLSGFFLASYAIVANDAIQTLGTFLSSNTKKPWWLLWAFACTLLTIVIVYSWVFNAGDVSYGRLAHIPSPKYFNWVYVIPPIVLLTITKFGIPASTTFLVLSIFSTDIIIKKMLVKSFVGYIVAFIVAIIVYRFVSALLEKHFLETNRSPNNIWVGAQWISTGFLWSQWLIQDLANIFAFLPRRLGLNDLIFALLVMYALHAFVFIRRGGEIQKIVTNKINTADIRSATIVDIVYGIILFFFKELSQIPMSTTFIFVGLLAGREVAIIYRLKLYPFSQVFKKVGPDAFKVLAGVFISLVLAVCLTYFK